MVDDVKLRVGYDDRDVRRGVRTTQRRLRDFERSARKVFRGIAAGVGGLAAGAAGFTAVAQRVASAVNEIDKASRAAAISSDALQELRFAFGQLSAATDRQVDVGLARFNQRLGEAAEGSGEAVDAFERLGVSIRDAGGRVRPTEQVLDQVIERIGDLPSDAERASAAADFFGRRLGPELAGALRQGSGALDELRQSAQAAGLVIDAELVANAARIADEFDLASRILTTQFQQALLALQPVISRVAVGLGNLGTNLTEWFNLTEGAVLRDRIEEINEARREITELIAGAEPGTREFDNLVIRLNDFNGRLQRARAELEALTARPVAQTGGGGAGTEAPPDAPDDTSAADARTEALQRQIDALEERIAADREAAAAARQTALADDEAAQAADEAARRKQEAIVADEELLQSLEEQIRLQGLSAREQAQAAAVSQLSSEATAAQVQQTRQLAGALFDLRDSAEQTTEEMSQFAVQAARNIQSAFADFLFDPFEDGLKGLAGNFVTTLRRMAAEAAAAQILQSIGTAAGGSGDNAFAAIFANVLHDGGRVGAVGGPRRRVPALAFAGAPRMHNGGIAGLRADEVPAILQRGERVVPRGGGDGVTVVQNIQTPEVGSFRLARGQLAADLAVGVGRARGAR